MREEKRRKIMAVGSVKSGSSKRRVQVKQEVKITVRQYGDAKIKKCSVVFSAKRREMWIQRENEGEIKISQIGSDGELYYFTKIL